MSAVELVAAFWQRMQSNDFAYAAELLADDYRLDWPQSQESVLGPACFAQLNREYPAHGRWQFEVLRIVGDAEQAVSEVRVSDGVQHARAITFSTVRAGKIVHQREFWPDPYPAPANRRHLVQPFSE